jgi:hypothetical protein
VAAVCRGIHPVTMRPIPPRDIPLTGYHPLVGRPYASPCVTEPRIRVAVGCPGVAVACVQNPWPIIPTIWDRGLGAC